MRDFTISIFKSLSLSFLNQDYKVIRFYDYCSGANNLERFVIFRHDVDEYPQNALNMAKIENELGMRTSYYFRICRSSYNERIIREIAQMGHEIGYHYEDLSLAKGDYEEAYRMFIDHLSRLRKLYPVKTICMHGSPLSPYDNRLLWKKYDYRELGIIGEPYLDIDFREVLYLTDTGRCWDSKSYNIRDKVETDFNFDLHDTTDIIKGLLDGRLPDKIMINIHPQRWNDKLYPWLKDLTLQKAKNLGKYFLIRFRG